MTLDEAKQAIGHEVIASANLWGEYKGQLLRTWVNLHASGHNKHKAVVKIHECTGLPSQMTIDGSKSCKREPYKKGKEIDFNLVDIARLNSYG